MESTPAKQLWDILPHPSSDHVVRLLARKKDKLVGDFARSSKEIERFTSACSDMNVYVALNPTKSTSGIRHTAEDVTHWSFLAVDIDPIEPDYDITEATTEVLNIIGGYSGHNLHEHLPTIVSSGRGVQLWLRMPDYEFTETFLSRTQVRRVMSYWLGKFAKRLGTYAGCAIDTSVSDLPRVMRCPGTINLKTGWTAKISHVQKTPYPWLYPFLWWGAPEEVCNEPPIPRHDGKTWQSAFQKLTLSGQEYLTKGKEEPGRHKVAWHVARSLRELGISREETRKALVWANQLQGEDQKLPNSNIEHALDTAYK